MCGGGGCVGYKEKLDHIKSKVRLSAASVCLVARREVGENCGLGKCGIREKGAHVGLTNFLVI